MNDGKYEKKVECKFGLFSPLKGKKSVLMHILQWSLIGSLVYELLFCNPLGSSLLSLFGLNTASENCTRFLDESLISAATTFSYSLTAFLLVAVAVVFAAYQQTFAGQDEDGDDGDDGDGGDDSPSNSPSILQIDHLSNETILEILEDVLNRGDEQEQVEVEIRDNDSLIAIVRGGSGSPSPNSTPNNDGADEPDDSEIKEFNDDLKQAVAYSVSASLLGIFITEVLPLPVVHPSSFLSNAATIIDSIGFTLLTHLFGFIFLGMVWTSVGLLDLLAINPDQQSKNN